MRLDDLSAELILSILELLPFPDITSILQLNHDWFDFVQLHQNTVYRQCAVLHGFVTPGLSLSDATSIVHDSVWAELTEADSWRAYCQVQRSLDRNWQISPPGPGVSMLVPADSWPHIVPPHRIKVDEEDRLLLTTTGGVGLVVHCAVNFDYLWSIDRHYIRPYAHLEYSNGFAVFDNGGNSHEVWVKTTQAAQFSSQSSPTDRQLIAAQTAPATGTRGRYTPHRRLQNPVPTRAYRFIFPELLVASQGSTTAHIWNVVTGKIIEGYSLAQGLGSAGTNEPRDDPDNDEAYNAINYVELSTTHIFVCFGQKLVVYQRRSTSQPDEQLDVPQKPPWREAVAVFELPESAAPTTRRYSYLGFDLTTADAVLYSTTGDPITTPPSHPLHFAAVHVSTDGSSLVAVTKDGEVYIVPDFQCSPDKVKIWLLRLQGEETITNLALSDRRICFATERAIFTIPLNDPSTTGHPMYKAYRVRVFNPESTVTSLQITDTSAWYAISPSMMIGNAPPNIVHLDFANHARDSPLSDPEDLDEWEDL